jgi:hypothetical protein
VPVTGWRKPALAPVYALTTAFVVVVGIGLLAPKPTLMVRMDASVPGGTVEVFEASDVLVQSGPLSEQGTYELPDMDGKRKVCVRLPAPWRVTELANSCTTDQVDKDVRVAAVRHGRVLIVFDGVPKEPAKVSLRDNSSVESAEVSASGFHQPRGSLAGQTICVEPPRGWVVQTPNLVVRDEAWCTSVADPSNDVEFKLVEGSLR